MSSNGWKKKPIGHLFDVQLGKMLSEKAKIGEQVPYLANFNVRWGSFDFSKLNEMAFSERERKKYALQHGDLLMCEGGEIGRCAIWNGHNKEIYYQKALHRVRPLSDECSTDYLYIFMQFIAAQGKLTRLVGETSIAHLTREKLLGLPIPLPPLPEQKAIADVLSKWDRAISTTERLIQAKEKRYDFLIQDMIGKHTRQWPHAKSKVIFQTVTEKKNENAELLSVTQDRGVIPRSMLEGRVMSPTGSTSSYKLIKNGDFAISLRSFQGGIEHSEYEGLISPAYTVLRPKTKICTEFYRHFFKSSLFIDKYLRIAVIGIRDGKQISIPDFLTVKIPSPPLDEQKTIAATLNAAQREIDLLKKLADKYKEQKRGLMQKLLTGVWRVKTREAV